MAAINPTISANLAHNATRFGAIPQVAAAARPAAFPAPAGVPLGAGFAGYPAAAAPAAFGPGVPAFGGAAFAPSPFNAVSPYTGAPAVYGGATVQAYPTAAVHPTVVAPTFAGAVPAALPNSLVPVTGAHLVDDWSVAHGYGYPATYGYGSLPANAAVGLGGVANLYDSRLVGTAAANPALYAASYGAPFGGYAAPSYVPNTIHGVPTYSALTGHATVAAANLYAPQAAAAQVAGLNAFAPNYFNSAAFAPGAGFNTFAPSYFGGFAGQFGAPALY